MDTISRLCDWFEQQCQNEWHEEHGVKIDTLDNPGWSLKIDLVGTRLEDRSLQEIKVERSEHDWFVIRRDGQTFEAFGGPRNLNEMIDCFLSWATNS